MRNNRISVDRGRFFASSGTNIKHVYDPIVMEDGTIHLSPSGTIDTDEHIEAQRASTELSVIISKYLAGDASVLNRYAPVYADLTEGPKNLAESMQALINAERAFDALLWMSSVSLVPIGVYGSLNLALRNGWPL